MDMEELVSCSICMETFDENVRPRSLPCGHTFCTDCINNGIEGGLLSCALCKKQHQASNGSDFPINYAIEALATKFRECELGAIPKQDQMSDVQPGGSRGVSKKMQTLIDDQKDQLKSLLKISHETKKDITEYKSCIQDRRGKHTELREKIQSLQQNNEEMIFQLEKEDKRVTDFLKEGEEHQKEAKKKLRTIYTLTNTTFIATASEEVERVQDDLEAWNEKCKMQLLCNETIRRSQKVIRKTTEALNLYEKDDDEAPVDFKDVLESDLSVMKRIEDLEESTPQLSLKSLRAKLRLAMGIWISGQVFAVQWNGSLIRSGRIYMSTNGKIYLHCLRECLPPVNAFTIPYDEVIEMVKDDSMTSFMDLSWEGSIKGRIHILLSPQTPLATHFYNLCTAQLGPSYLHTTFIHKYNDDNSCSYVIGGDYERDDGSGGAPIFQGLDKNSDIYRRELKDGSVGIVDHERDGPRSAQFRMYTKGPWKQSNGIFGQVEDGLELVRELMRIDDIKKVRIEDCGIVLPFDYQKISSCVFVCILALFWVLGFFFNR